MSRVCGMIQYRAGAASAELLPEAREIVPGVTQRLLLRVRDGHARPVAAPFLVAGEHVEDGLRHVLREQLEERLVLFVELVARVDLQHWQGGAEIAAGTLQQALHLQIRPGGRRGEHHRAVDQPVRRPHVRHVRRQRRLQRRHQIRHVGRIPLRHRVVVSVLLTLAAFAAVAVVLTGRRGQFSTAMLTAPIWLLLLAALLHVASLITRS